MIEKFVVVGQFTSSEVNTIIKDCQTIKMNPRPARTTGDSDNDRKGVVAWATPEQHFATYNITQSAVLQHFSQWNLSLENVAEIQYARYDKGDFFRWHRDGIPTRREDKRRRGLTMSINLTDPSEYSDGEMIVDVQGTHIKLPKHMGSYIIFPAFLRHQASTVTEGTREALVVWTYLLEEEIKWLANLDK